MAGVSVLGFPGMWNNVDSQNVGFGLTGQVPPEIALEEQALNRRQQLANVLMQHSMQAPQGQMAGRFYVAPSWTQGLAQLGAAGAGAFLTHQNDQSRKGLADQSQSMLSDAMKAYQQRTAPQQTETPINATRAEMPDTWDINELQGGNVTGFTKPAPAGDRRTMHTPSVGIPIRDNPGMQPTTATTMTSQPQTPEERQQAIVETLMMSQHPQARAIGQALLTHDTAKQEHATQREFLAGQNEQNRDVSREKMSAQLDQMVMLKLMTQDQANVMREKMDEQAKLNRDNQLQVAKIGAAGKTDSAHIRADAATNKPMTANAVNHQNEELTLIGTLSGVNADLASLKNQIDSGGLKLGMADNLLSRGKNAIGLSDENSRNFASFKATMEKQRNTSLLLNKGVQTEGDAQRAWNELFENINDPKVVSQRLGEIQKINERGVSIRKLNVDNLRKNWNQEPLDFSQYEQQAPAVGQGGNTGGWSIRPIQ